MTAAGKRRIAAAAVGILAAVPVAVGFIVSWGAQRDAALAAHVAPDAARLYAVGVDGLITVALIAALVLRHDRHARRYCLAVLVAFSASSLVLNIAHGAGAFQPGGTPGWALTALVTAQPVAAIAFGSHLLVHVLRAWFPALARDGGTRGTAGGIAGTGGRAGQRATGSAARASQTSPGAGDGVDTRHRGEPTSATGNAAVVRLRSTTRPTDAAAPVPGSKTEAICQFRAEFVASHGREPNGKEAAAGTGASERMARKVLGELRGTDAEPELRRPADPDAAPDGVRAEEVG